MGNGIYRLKNRVQDYSWGSVTYIPEFLGRDNPRNIPQAELWMGMHPRGESKVVIGKKQVPLSEVVQANPEGVLGKKTASSFAGKLPFLFKVLAAGKPLSIQAHPSLQQAKAGFDRENREDIPLDAPHRNYRDDNHKPELIYALTPFWALRGFRRADEILVEFLSLNLSSIHFEVDQLKQNADREGLKDFFRSLITLSAEVRAHLLEEIAAASDQREEPRYRWVEKLNAAYPGDIGILCPLLLNCIRMEPGTAMFLPAGELHAYLDGFGIEIMANSDNVLRGGLTEKHIDVPELLKTLTFHAGPVEYLTPAPAAPSEELYSPPVPEFQLSRIVLEEGRYLSAEERQVEILLCTEGELQIIENGSSAALKLKKGNSVIVYADSPGYVLEGGGVVFKATSP